MKYLSSIFSFDTLNLKRRHFLGSAAKLVILGVLLIEILLRIFVPDGHQPAGRWKNQQTRVKSIQIEQADKVDLLFTGSSVASVNISPQLFDAELKNHGVNLTSYNAGIAGSDWQGIAAALEKVFWEKKKTEYVLFIISPYDLDEENTGVRKRTISFVESLNRPFYELAALDFFSNIWLFGFRNEVKDFLKTFKWKSEPLSVVSNQGFTPMYKGCSFNIEYPVTIKRDGEVSRALLNLVSKLNNEGVNILIAEALLTSKFRKYNEDKLENFYLLIDEMKKLKNVKFLDLSGIIPDDNYFIDPFHLNIEGSSLYSRSLAHFLLSRNVFKLNSQAQK
jgi:hypothetical protein